MAPIFIPIRTPGSGGGINQADALRALNLAGIALALILFSLFLSFKPLSLTVMQYTEVPNVATYVNAELAKAAADKGFSEVEVRPWGWLFGLNPLNGTMDGKPFPFKATTDSWSGTSFAYRLELSSEGIPKLWLHHVPTSEKEARAMEVVISTDLKKLLKAKVQYLRDAEFRRTGVLPAK